MKGIFIIFQRNTRNRVEPIRDQKTKRTDGGRGGRARDDGRWCRGGDR